MSTWLNFATIRERISLEMVLTEYAKVENLRRQGDRLIGPCPIHKGDSPRAFHADLGKNVWFCFTRCHRGGNQLDFVAALENISVREAGLRLHAFFLEGGLPPPSDPVRPYSTRSPKNRDIRPPTKPSPTKENRTTMDTAKPTPEPVRKNSPLSVKLELDPSHPHLTEVRKLSKETIALFGVGYCKKGIMKGTIAIPIHEENGTLVAYAGRRLKAEDIEAHGKYVLPKGFHKDLVLFNFHRAKSAVEVEGLVLVEGFFAVMALHEMGLRNVVASMGSDVSDQQAELLGTSPEVIVLYDGDEAGRAGGERVVAKLKDKTKVRLIKLPEGQKPDTVSPRSLRWALNGARALDLDRIDFGFAPPK